MADIARNLVTIRQRIDAACHHAGRNPAEVNLVAVSKTFPPEVVREAYDAGQRVFGENYLQEALQKIEALPADIHWHYIGRVQRNKLRKILTAFEVVHGIDSLALAQAADRIGAELDLRPRIFLQVNLGGELSKGGYEPEQLMIEFPALLEFSRIDIRGLMAIPPPAESAAHAREMFAILRDLRDRLQAAYDVSLPELSMGMSEDFEAAIQEGATHIRIGSAIFGSRSYPTPSPA
jgi:pyridoxal phosphate enzyme (YggS family)